MKRGLLLWSGLVLALCISGCDVTLMAPPTEPVYLETFGTRPPKEDSVDALTYKDAMAALAELDYARAYRLFLELGDYRDAAQYAARFVMLDDLLLRAETYEDGVLTQTMHYYYDADGKPQQEEPIASGSSKNSLGLTEKWVMYPDRRETETYRDDLRVGYRVESFSILPGAESMTVTYRYNADGVLKEDTGHVQVCTEVKGDRSVFHQYNFAGSYILDEAGRVKEYLRTYSAGASGQLWQAYEYDEAGRVIRLEEDNTLSAFGQDSKALHTITQYRYDENGTVTWMHQHTVNAGVETVVETWYIYENGRLIREESTLTAEETVSIHKLYIYGEYCAYNMDGKE
jgi:hypothetical protein